MIHSAHTQKTPFALWHIKCKLPTVKISKDPPKNRIINFRYNQTMHFEETDETVLLSLTPLPRGPNTPPSVLYCEKEKEGEKRFFNCAQCNLSAVLVDVEGMFEIDIIFGT